MKHTMLLSVLAAVCFCLPAASQTLDPSVRIDREALTDSIQAFARHRTPQTTAYFRSLTSVEEAYRPAMAAIDCTTAALMADPSTQQKATEYATSVADITMEYDVLLQAVVLSRADEILNLPSVKASLEQARVAIRHGADADRAWKIARRGLYDLPRYKNNPRQTPQEKRRLAYEFAALNNALSTLTLYEFDRLIRERDAGREGADNIRVGQ